MLGFLDLTVNWVALLLWFNGRGAVLEKRISPTIRSLASAIQPTETGRSVQMGYWMGLVALLLVRALFYHHIGSAMGWIPSQDLHWVQIHFKSHVFSLMLLYSAVEFLLFLLVAYSWLTVVSALHGHSDPQDPVRQLIDLHLGRLAAWPSLLKWAFPMAGGATYWFMVVLLARDSALLPAALPTSQILSQALLIGASFWLDLQPLLLGLVSLYFLNSYVYLGDYPLLKFVDECARQILKPIRRIPHRIGPIDFSPLLACALLLLGFQLLSDFLQRGMSSPGVGF